MDVACKQFGRLNIEQSILLADDLKRTCKNYGGIFRFVFHNESLSGHRGWQNWDKVLDHLLHE